MNTRNLFLFILLFCLAALDVILLGMASLFENLSVTYFLWLKPYAVAFFCIATGLGVVSTIALGQLEKQRKRKKALKWYTLNGCFVLLEVISAFSIGLSSTLLASALPSVIRPFVHTHDLVLLVCVLVGELLISFGLIHLVDSRQSKKDFKERIAFLTALQSRYGERRDALADSSASALGLTTEDECKNARALIQPKLSLDGSTSLVGISIFDAYAYQAEGEREATGKLILQGGSGAGRTTLLLGLAIALIKNILQLVDQPPGVYDKDNLKIPVIFSIAPWVVKPQPLAEWMKTELIRVYGLSRKSAHAWVEDAVILPLFDGLDEIADWNLRGRCIQAVHEYHQDCERVQKNMPLVITTRTEYLDLLDQLKHSFHTFLVQPLSHQQIEAYLARGKGHFDGLLTAIANDNDLYAVACTPLMLNIAVILFRDKTDAEIRGSNSASNWKESLFDAYVPRMLQRPPRGANELGNQQDMIAQDQTARNTMPGNGGAVPMAPYSYEEVMNYLGWLATQLQQRGLLVFYYDFLQWDWLPAGQNHPLSGPTLVEGQMDWKGNGWPFWRNVALAVWMVIWLASAAIGVMASRLESGILLGGAIGPTVAIIVGLGGLFFDHFGGSTNVMKPKTLKREGLRHPGEYIARSGKSGIVGGLVEGLTYVVGCVLIFGVGGEVVGEGVALVSGWTGTSRGDLSLSVFVGMLIGVIFGIPQAYLAWRKLGGAASREALELQRKLEEADCIPPNYINFLDFAAEHILLQHDGGGYSFIHSELCDYFANQWKVTHRVYNTYDAYTDHAGADPQAQQGVTPRGRDVTPRQQAKE